MSQHDSLLKRIQNTAIPLAVLVFTLFTLMGVNSSLHALETRVFELNRKVTTLERIDNHIRTLQADVKEIGEMRNDILQAIEDAARRAAATAARRR